MRFKDRYQESVLGRTIAKVYFEIHSEKDISKHGHMECSNPELYAVTDRDQQPILGGANDQRLGLGMPRGYCKTCALDQSSCPGHFGEIPLNLPCFHPGYLKKVIQILSCICKKCGKMLLDKVVRGIYREKFLDAKDNDQKIKSIFKDLIHRSKMVKSCSKCKHFNGTVKKLNSVSLCHEMPSSKAKGKPKESLTTEKSKGREVLNTYHIYHLLQKISSSNYIFFGIRGNFNPSRLMLKNIPVSPACIRPTVYSEFKSGTNEDDLTVKMTEIIYKNAVIEEEQARGFFMSNAHHDWDILSSVISTYLMGNVSGLPARIQPNKSIRSLMQRLKGKHGRFRGNLSGKRVDFSARTVISPDPNILITQVVVPKDMAMVLTFPERVNKHNIEKLRKLILNGTFVYPGANFIFLSRLNFKKYIRKDFCEEIAKNLAIGDIVERHLLDGDVVLFNRQPSLHRISIMAHKVKVMENRTLRFNECCCTPYNADFDGDEMNIHFPQTYEAQAEAISLMGVDKNIQTPRNGDPLIASVQDFITGAYLLSGKDRFYTKSQFTSLVSWILANDDRDTYISCPPPAIFKPIPLWTGKQIISCIINPGNDSKIPLNLRTKGKNYTNGEEMCQNDSYIVFYNGFHLVGTLDKNIIGSGSKKTIYYALLKNFGPHIVSKIMLRFNRITSYFLINNGFSIGIDDVTASSSLISRMDVLVADGYSKCNQFIEDYKYNRMQTQPGLTLEETLEGVILKELSSIRDNAFKICRSELPSSCSPLIMALCGSKGSFINISQMIACVGQQAINGKRTPNGFNDRSLPMFPKYSRTPEAKGFVRNSFFRGLTPTEFYFHTMAGREGLVDTAVKTAETGYMQRRLIKCCEDICVQYDNTVRNSNNKITQFTYGADGLDPINMETEISPIDYDSLFLHIYNLNTPIRDPVLSRELTIDIGEKYLLYKSQGKYKKFCKEIYEFLLKITKKIPKGIVLSTEVHIFKITRTILQIFIDECFRRYLKSFVEPGTTVGSLCAQSIGEPATQMTLKTFHFAGVASMNITQGVPRLKEIINSVSKISTPIIKAKIKVNNDLEFARHVKGQIEKTTLGQISTGISVIIDHSECYISVTIDIPRINLLQLDINLDTIEKSIDLASNLKIKIYKIVKIYPSMLKIFPAENKKENVFFTLMQLKLKLKDVIVKGFAGIHRAVVTDGNESGSGPPDYGLTIEGTDFLNILGTKSTISKYVESNSPLKVSATLGIEAARETLIRELSNTMKAHSIQVDYRHFYTLADLMCQTGMVLGMTRHGLNKQKEGTLMLASFEGVGDILFDAAYHGKVDTIKGVSESIIVGSPINVGTGMIKIIQKPQKPFCKKTEQKISRFERMYRECKKKKFECC